jgi:hypothetical protein
LDAEDREVAHGDELVLPLDASDPRFLGSGEDVGPDHPRRLVPNEGPGASRFDPRVRLLRAAIPLVGVAGILMVMVVFWQGLDPPSGRQVIGDEAEVRAAVAERPHRVCLGGSQPCGWLTVVDGELLALNTSGPLREEYGRAGVVWCSSSGWFGSNSLGSRFDQAGVLARGPAPRGLDRYEVTINDAGEVVVHFFSLTTALQAARVERVQPPGGPHCEEEIPFDREADLEL